MQGTILLIYIVTKDTFNIIGLPPPSPFFRSLSPFISMHLTGIILLIFNFVRVYAKFRLNVDQKTLSTASSAVNYPSNSLANYQTFSSLKHTGYSVRFVRPTLCDSDLQQVRRTFSVFYLFFFLIIQVLWLPGSRSRRSLLFLVFWK